MVRRPYLTRLTLGRSAFEPPDAVEQPAEEAIASSSDPREYVQRYDDRGYPINPEARAVARQLRRAQNDVLATVGVCVGKDAADARIAIQNRTRAVDREKIGRVVAENETGLAIAAADLGLMFTCLWWTAALRARIQTFNFYDGIPFRDIFNIELKHLGVWNFIFAGMPAWVTSFLINMFRSYVLDEIIDWIWDAVHSKFKNRRLRRFLRISKPRVYTLLNCGLYFGLTIPLQLFSHLQLLGLIPPLAVPSTLSFLPFNMSSPLQLPPWPTTFSASSILTFAGRLVCSPFVLHLLSLKAREWVEPNIYFYLRTRLPIPDNPDYLSLEASREDDLDSGAIPGIGWTKDREPEPSIANNIINRFNDVSDWVLLFLGLRRPSAPHMDEVARVQEAQTQVQRAETRLQAAERRAREAGARLDEAERQVRELETRYHSAQAEGYDTPLLGTGESSEDHHDQNQGRPRSSSSTATPSAGDLFDLDEVFSNAGPQRPTIPPLATTTPSSLTRLRRASTLNSTTTFPTSRPSSPPDSPIPAHSVRVSAHPASENDEEDSVTMQLEMGTLMRDPNDLSNITLAPPEPTPHRRRQPLTDLSDTLSAPLDRDGLADESNQDREDNPFLPSHEPAPELRPHHRVTALSNHPPDSLASHTAALLSNLIFLPLDAFFYRRLAHAYLSAPGIDAASTATALGLRRDVRILWPFGGAADRLDYAEKMVLALGMQVQMSSVLWMCGVQGVMWAGRRYFGWGRL